MKEWKPEYRRWAIRGLRVLFVLYLLVLLYLLFLSERYGRTAGVEVYRYNLIPFKEIKRYILNYNRVGVEAFFINMYGNILAFVPFGFLLPGISKKDRSFLATLLWSFALTLTVEVTQLISRVGCFDVDDMILNVTGALLGYGLYALGRRVFRKLFSKEAATGEKKL